jgi:hypothetical protein
LAQGFAGQTIERAGRCPTEHAIVPVSAAFDCLRIEDEDASARAAAIQHRLGQEGAGSSVNAPPYPSLARQVQYPPDKQESAIALVMEQAVPLAAELAA